MNPIESFLSAKRAAGVRLWLEEGQLRFRTSQGALSPDALGEIRSRKAEIVAYLEGAGGLARLPPLVPQPRTGAVPLSFGQERIWSWQASASAENDPEFYGFFAIRLHGAFDAGILKCALERMVARHEALRTRIAVMADGPMQLIDQAGDPSLEIEDLSALPEAARDREARRRGEEFLRRPVDVGLGPLFRTHLSRLSATEHVVIAWLHPLFADAWSVALVRRELAALYAALSQSQPVRLPAPSVQFADYVLWKRKAIAKILDLHLAYWKEHLAGAPPLRLPTDRPRPAASGARGALLRFALESRLISRLDALSRHERVTQFAILFGAFQAVLSRWSAQRDVVVGVIGARAMSELQNVVGFCANYAPVRTDLSGDPVLRDVLECVQKTVLEQNEHYYPHIENLSEILRPGQPFCRVQFHFHPSPLRLGTASGPSGFGHGFDESDFDLRLQRYAFHEDLVLTLQEGHRNTVGVVLYDHETFEARSIRGFVADYLMCLEGIARDPGQRLSVLHGRATRSRPAA